MFVQRVIHFFLPCFGLLLVGGLWWFASAYVSTDLPSPFESWEESKLYVLKPFEKRGETDQGMGC